jgi:predicted enzyme related to lactoylglutathione lyase
VVHQVPHQDVQDVHVDLDRRHAGREGQRWIELGIPRAETKVVLYRPEDGAGIGTFQRISFQADDVEATWRELKKRGVEFTQEPQTESWGTAAGFKDPDGNTFVLSSK